MKLNPRLRATGAAVATAAVLPLVVAGVSAPATGAEHEGLPGGVLVEKSLVIGVDGAMFNKWDALDLPTFEGLVDQGTSSTFNLYAEPLAPTVSGPAWTSIATGVWPDKHKVVDNAFAERDAAGFPDYLTRLEAANPAISTLVVGTWGPVPQQIFTGADVRISGANDAGTTEQASDYLAHGNPDATFVHLDEVDGAGHSFGNASPQYATQLAEVDQQIRTLLDAVEGRASYAQEHWQVILTADHGHTSTGGHGGSSRDERSSFVIATGPGTEPGIRRHDVKLVDIAPTVLDHLGVEVDPEWRLDGRPLPALEPDAFDALRPALRTQVDETRPGADTLGWTHEAPAGWSIDNSAMPEGGVTELRGWTFVTDDFWTNIELNQKRETSVRNRDVFAVADSDEWDDKAHAPGAFDSTLVSPAYPIEGGGKVKLSYATNYQWDGSTQRGEIYAVWNGGEPQLVKTYGDSAASNTNANEIVDIAVPRGASELRLRFRYYGTNSYFWTIDQVDVAQLPESELAVSAIDTSVTSLDVPGPATPWQVDAAVSVTTTAGAPVKGATVSARLRFDGRTTPLEQVTDAAGVARFRAYAQYADQATFEVIDVSQGDLEYFGEKDAVSSVTVARPTRLGTLTAAPPTIVGRPHPRELLVAVPGRWSPTGVELHYQWYAGRRALAGATDQVLELTKRHRGERIRVEVTGTKPGFATLTRASTSTSVVR
ncbi:alkaline phosphatase family protein [Nocardioides houyundeii]|uniref:alkaline phosphatase family protein n=1 Tax=Nocardioides houyundeii TaxID=2045452 RepID=UPI000DF4A7E4|nr:alkaline phosphatase family protein [Nocardioides houyundeii]